MNNALKLIFGLLFLVCLVSACNPFEKTVQLPKGSAEGTYVYTFTGKIAFTQEPLFPVSVSIMKEAEEEDCKVETIEVDYPGNFTIKADLPPGTFNLYSSPPGEEECCSSNGKYWGAWGNQFVIEAGGILRRDRLPKDVLTHKLVMKLTSPENNKAVNTKRPTLVWEPVEGAEYYKVTWFLKEGPKTSGKPRFQMGIKVTDPEYRFSEDVMDGAMYVWRVETFDGDDEEIAYFSDYRFKTSLKERTRVE